MKKLLALLLAMMMVFTLAACGDNNTTDPNKDNPGTSQTDNQGGENQGGESTNGDNQDGEENKDDRFTEFGLSFSEIEPEGSTGYEVPDNSNYVYTVVFAMPDVVSEAFGTAYYKKLYNMTATIADGGSNYKKIGGSRMNPELEAIGDWDSAGIYDSHMVEWYYKLDGKLYGVIIMGGIGLNKEISVSINIYS